MSDRYIVYAFYPNLGIKVRGTQYSNKSEMYEYIGQGLRMCDTPYIAIDSKDGTIIDGMETKEVDRIKMSEMLQAEWSRMEQKNE